MIEDLKGNIKQEKKIMEEIEAIGLRFGEGNEKEKKFYLASLNGLKMQLKVLNDAVPILLKNLSPIKKLDGSVGDKKPENIMKLGYISPSSKKKRIVVIDKKDKNKFAAGLKDSEDGRSKFRKEQNIAISKPSYIAHISNKFFSDVSEKLAPSFNNLKEDLKKANVRFTISTYLSIALFITFFVFVFVFLIEIVLIIFDFSYIMWIWVPFVLAALCAVGFYAYPSTEKASVQKKISEELPFATIYMAAIAGSDIEPTKIFKIIAMSPEYKNIGYEMKKVVNQVDVYGYDLVSALKNSAKTTSNKDLAELFSGLATNIVSGGSLRGYLEKKADNFLVDYRLERQKYSRLAETFMDLYISILVAAPMVLMMLVVVMNLTNISEGLSLNLIVVIAIGAVAAVNIIFLIVIQIKQPRT